MFKRTHLHIVAGLALLPLIQTSYGVDLLQIYQQAQQHDATFQQAAATYEAAKESLPIARAALLPSVTLTANTTINYQNTTPFHYNSNGYTLTLTQPVINLSAWGLYSQAHITVAEAALTFGQAQQQLIIDVVTAYFNVLEAQEKFSYAKAYQAQLQQQLNQTQEQYKVGLKAMTDVQSTKASYETAVADTISAQNSLDNTFEQLTQITGVVETDLTPLAENAPLIKPVPASADAWVNAALQGNIALQTAHLQADFAKTGVHVAQLGNGSVPGYFPTLNAVGTKAFSRTHNEDIGSNPSSSGSNTQSAGLSLSYSLFNGGSTYYTVQQATYTAQSSEFSLEQTRRQTISNTRQGYLNILSDISQVEAFKQAMLSGESSLQAITAAYNVGTRTIVDLLTQQSNLFNSQQQYASARYQYILDSVQLKADTGLLSPSDVVAINQWLSPITAS